MRVKAKAGTTWKVKAMNDILLDIVGVVTVLAVMAFAGGAIHALWSCG